MPLVAIATKNVESTKMADQMEARTLALHALRKWKRSARRSHNNSKSANAAGMTDPVVA
jgi:hypothetical protein